MDTSLREGRRHRSWPEALKREIVAASLEPGSSVSLVALVGISASQLAYMLDGIDWRNPRHTFRPERAG
jgi:transposase-like protein